MTFQWRAIIAMVVCGVVAGLGGLVYAQRQPYTFGVEAKLWVMLGREPGKLRADIQAQTEFRGSGLKPKNTFINGVVGLLKSDSVMRATVTSLADDIPGFYETTLRRGYGGLVTRAMSSIGALFRRLDLNREESLENLSIQEWSRRLTVNITMRTDVIRVECAANDPAIGVAFVERLIEKYMDAHIVAFNQADSEITLSRELRNLHDQKDEARAAVHEWRIRSGVVDLQKAIDHLIEQQGALEHRLRGIRVEIAATRASAEAIEESLGGVPERSMAKTVSGNDPITDHIEQMVVASEVLERQLSVRFPLGSPMLGRTRAYTKRLRELHSERPAQRDGISVAESRDPLHETLAKMELANSITARALEAEGLAVRESLTRVGERLIELEGMRAEAGELATALEDVGIDLSVVSQAALTARMVSFLDDAGIINVRVMNPPRAFSQPVKVMGRNYRISIIYGWAAFGMFIAAAYYMLKSAIMEDFIGPGSGAGGSEPA